MFNRGLITTGAITGIAIAGLLRVGVDGAAGTSVVTATGKRAPTIDDVRALAGSWRAESGGHIYEETWLPPSNGQMTGAMRSFDGDGKLLLLELITITEIDAGLEYRLRHFDGAMTPWASEANGPLIMRGAKTNGGRAVFDEVIGAESIAGAEIDLSAPDRMVFTLRFAPDENGEGGQFDINFERSFRTTTDD